MQTVNRMRHRHGPKVVAGGRLGVTVLKVEEDQLLERVVAGWWQSWRESVSAQEKQAEHGSPGTVLQMPAMLHGDRSEVLEDLNRRLKEDPTMEEMDEIKQLMSRVAKSMGKEISWKC